MNAMDPLPLYRQLASHYLNAIDNGTLAVGARMPSVRTLMARHSVSLSTALQACRELEQQGVLEARPRSGYFVRARTRALAPAVEPVLHVADPAQYVGIHERVSAITARSLQADVQTNLGGACGAPELYPNEALSRTAQRVLRQKPMLFGENAPHNGEPSFRLTLAQRALTHGMQLTTDDIIVAHGCVEALNLALRAVAQPGDIIAVESPTFFGLLQILETLGMRALEIPTSPQTGMSLEALQRAAETYPELKAVVVVPNFQNPLGSIMPDATKQALVAWCEQRDIALIEDDTYSALTNDDVPLRALKAWDKTGNVIHCASLHKVVSPGMRLGWIAPGKWLARCQMLKYAQTRPNEALNQLVLADYMATPAYDRHLRRLRQHLRTQRLQVADAVAAYFPEETRLSVPSGGLGLWVELPDQISSREVFERGLDQGIRIAPGMMFSNSTRFDHFIRLSVGLPYTPEVERAIRALARIVDRMGRVAA
ncbi:putative HTH-type transcriptional regulator YjiR [Amantichitinum ursilacus]|uniref:Putative 8-amino-7-oxononanoate synthase n=2 Tax=Amantichitinum ursilacus TaxID=857265 RepID=A0A0N1JSZ7_9NEIS|nr:putative HTH-type transcriptional regulator YjiR [Amantichitinum ursilacus]